MPVALEVLSWSFWSPESRNPQEWRTAAAAQAPTAVLGDAIPASHRRRMSTLSKMAVQTALEAARDARPDFVVFCSQHGEHARTRELLASIVSRTEMSPTSFSQSVHNTSAGLYSIITASNAPATSLAAGPGTFAYGWIEAESFVAVHAGKQVLLVCYDEMLSSEYRPYSRQDQRSYALALLLGQAAHGGFRLEASEPKAEELAPLAPLFMAWALSVAPVFSVTAGGQGWTWRRVGA
jgi:3-oxoacyl-[acyl-carrier-protein] synthase III